MSLEKMKKQIDKFNDIRAFAEFECGEERLNARHAADEKSCKDKILELARNDQEYNDLSIAGSNPTGAVRKKMIEKYYPRVERALQDAKTKARFEKIKTLRWQAGYFYL